MRSIKFRGKTKGTEKCVDGLWVYGYLFKDVDDKSFILYDFPGSFGNKRLQKIEVIPKTVGQLLATVGRIEVYEGDVLVNPRGTEFTAMIWDNLPCLKENRIDRMILNPMVQGYLNNKKVIGNIHEESEVQNG